MPEKEPESEDIFNLERIRRLIQLMKEHDLGEIDLQQAEQRIKLTRWSAGSLDAMSSLNKPVAQATPAIDLQRELDGEHIVTLKSPMVGTFYSRANPNAADFVSVGSIVQLDTQVCIIEAMKVFNEIPAEVRGKIVAVLVRNEEPVDFGRPLFKVDTRG